MTVELDRTDIITLIKGCFIPFSMMDDKILKKMGKFIGGFTDEWRWEYKPDISEFSDEELWNVYLKLKKDYK
jgi:hypothetical protein